MQKMEFEDRLLRERETELRRKRRANEIREQDKMRRLKFQARVLSQVKSHQAL
jgi:hypothetical protein